MFTSVLTYFSAKIKNDDSRELLKGSSLAFLFKTIGFVAGYFFTLIVTRTLGAESWGIFSLSLSILTIFSVISRLGMDTAVLKLVSEMNAKGEQYFLVGVYRKVLITVFFWGGILTLLLYFSSDLIAQYIFKNKNLGFPFRISALGIIPFSAILIFSEGFRGLKQITHFAFFQFVAKFLFSIIFYLPIYYLTMHQSAPLISFISALYISLIISYFLWIRQNKSFLLKEKNKKNTLYDSTLKIINFSLPFFITSSVLFINGYTDTIMLGIFTTEKEVGIYNVVLKLAAANSFILAAINSISAPKFSELHGTGNHKRLKELVQKSTKLIFYTSLPLIVLFFAFPEILLKMFGPEFIEAKYALYFLTVGSFINAISGSVGYLINMTGKQHVTKNILLTGALINVTLNYFLIPLYGINGAAFASMISMAFWNLTMVLYIKSKFGFLTIYIPYLIKAK